MLCTRETDAGTLAIADVPVKLCQVVLDQQVTGRRIEPTNIDAVGVLGNRLRAGQCGRRNRDLAARGTADQAKVRRGTRALQFLIREEEEQLVLKDWPTDGQTLGGLLEFWRCGVNAGEVVVSLARETVVTEDEVRAALDLVRSALGHRIDVGAGIALLSHVHVGDVDLHRLNGVDRNRLLKRREVVGFETERIADRNAVNGGDVVLGVLSRD